MGYSLAEAARASGKSKMTIQRAIKGGKISASRNENGSYDIDPSELHRMFPVVSDDDTDKGNTVDAASGYANGYRIGQGEDDGWGLFNILELSRMLIPTDTFFFDHKSGRTVHRQSYGRIVRDTHFTPRRLSDCIPLNERTLGINELAKARKEEPKKPVMMKPETMKNTLPHDRSNRQTHELAD